jgi:hypothetical protein
MNTTGGYRIPTPGGGALGGRKKISADGIWGEKYGRGREKCAKCQRIGKKRERKEEKGEEKERKWKLSVK